MFRGEWAQSEEVARQCQAWGLLKSHEDSSFMALGAWGQGRMNDARGYRGFVERRLGETYMFW